MKIQVVQEFCSNPEFCVSEYIFTKDWPKILGNFKTTGPGMQIQYIHLLHNVAPEPGSYYTNHIIHVGKQYFVFIDN
jgi:hypothetical protein